MADFNIDDFARGEYFDPRIFKKEYQSSPDEAFNTEMNKKTVLFIDGPKQGEIQTVCHNEMHCCVQPEIPKPCLNKEETLVIDKDGNEEWISTHEEKIRIPEPKQFEYKVITLRYKGQVYDLAVNKKKFLAHIKEAFFDESIYYKYAGQCEQDSNIIHSYLEKINSPFTLEGIKESSLADKCRRKGLLEQITKTDYSDYELTKGRFKDIVKDMFTGMTSAAFSFDPAVELEQEQNNSDN